jgi:hypothetical protein
LAAAEPEAIWQSSVDVRTPFLSISLSAAATLKQIDQAFPLRFGMLQQSRIFRGVHGAIRRLIRRRR